MPIRLLASLALLPACRPAPPDLEFIAPHTTGTESPPAHQVLRDVRELLAPFPSDTRWAEVPDDVQAELEAHVMQSREAFREAWGESGLAEKRAVISADSSTIAANVDDYARRMWVGLVDPMFTLGSLDNAPFAEAVRGLYLAHLGQARANTTVYGFGSGLDWDGVTPVRQLPVPDPEAFDSLQTLADEIVLELDGVDGGSAQQAELVRVARLRARSLRAGSHVMRGYGGDDFVDPAIQPVFTSSVAWGYAPDEVETQLRYQNAVWWNEAPVQLSRHRVDTLHMIVLPSVGFDEQRFVDGFADPEYGRMSWLLAAWSLERLEAHPDAASGCHALTGESGWWTGSPPTCRSIPVLTTWPI
jgi:hypothetical protein